MRGPASDRVRLCAVSRVHHPEADLIRFVAGPDDAVVPDLARRLPGRGVWVEATRTAVAAAVSRKVFARSLKRPVVAPAGLTDLVEQLLVRRAMDALSMANKAGAVTTGFAKIDAALSKGEGRLLVHASEAADDGRQKLDRKLAAMARAHGRELIVVDCMTNDQLSLAIGRENVVHALLKTSGATEKFAGEAGRVMRFRSLGALSSPASVAEPTPSGRTTDEA